MDYKIMETAALLEHAKLVTSMIKEAKPSTAALIDELAKRLNDRSPLTGL